MSELKNLNLICGSETYLMQKKRDALLKELGAEGSINFNRFSGRDMDQDELMRLSQTLPFMEEQRVIYVEESGLFKGSHEELLNDISAIPDSTMLIFYETSIDKNSKLYKLFKSKGEIFSYDNAEIKDFKKADKIRADIRRWVSDRLDKEGYEIGGRELSLLLELCGYDMQNLISELEKHICLRLNEKKPYRISKEYIDSICSKSVKDRVFDMISAKLSGDRAKALMLCEDMLSLKTPPGRILYLLEKQFNSVYIMRSMAEEGLSEADIMRSAGLTDWQFRKLRKDASGINSKTAYYYLKLSVELETKIKTGDISDRIALEMLLAA